MTTAVVTGGNSGIGYFISEQLASRGIRVIMASRSEQRADAAAAAIRARYPSADLGFVPLDLSSLVSIGAAAGSLAELGPIDLLINNAGLTSGSSRRQTTVDGLELTVGTNGYGHFAFTAQVFASLASDAAIVNLGSLSTRLVTADIEDLEQTRGKFSFSRAYGTSKHVVHATAFELDRRLRARDSGIRSVLAHPGFALDSLSSPREGITSSRFAERLLAFAAQGKDDGAVPVVHAALEGASGEFWGPRFQVKGRPVLVKPVAQSASPEFGARVWELATAATGVDLPA